MGHSNLLLMESRRSPCRGKDRSTGPVPEGDCGRLPMFKREVSSADSPTASLIIVLWGLSKVVFHRHGTEGEHVLRSASSHKSRVCDLELIGVPQRRVTYLHVTGRYSCGLYNCIGPNFQGWKPPPLQKNPYKVACNILLYAIVLYSDGVP